MGFDHFWGALPVIVCFGHPRMCLRGSFNKKISATFPLFSFIFTVSYFFSQKFQS